jgi:hypothetical protein
MEVGKMPNDYYYIDLEKMYFSPNPPKYQSEVKRERLIILFVIILLMGLTVGIPLFVNIGKAIFEITPIIY